MFAAIFSGCRVSGEENGDYNSFLRKRSFHSKDEIRKPLELLTSSFCAQNGFLFSYASAAPSAAHFATPSSSGASLQITLSAARLTPFCEHFSSHERIHAPSPQP